MSVRMFQLSEICTHLGFVCRIDKVTRNITAIDRPSLAYMGIEDETEFDPILTLTPLYDREGNPVKNPKPRHVLSGAVYRLSEEVQKIESEITCLQERRAFLTGLGSKI